MFLKIYSFKLKSVTIGKVKICFLKLHLHSLFVLNLALEKFREIGQKHDNDYYNNGLENSFRGLIYNFVCFLIIYKAFYPFSLDLIITNELGHNCRHFKFKNTEVQNL